ncbi:uncharacterized protein LOC134280177 [Saccostrea cucullata]|uniref:uncharacterized protein LOC134280177 n=1 Tax=Saccostrea cuccullata TaxID=36930 RepID=UPI002ED5348A
MTKGSSNRNTGVGFAPDKGEVIQLEKKPAVVSFNPFSSEAHKRLADLFLDDYHYIIVHSSQDISKIQSKVVYLFVDVNDRNIILEAETETQQIKRETVETIRRIGGTPVVIYRLHSESRNLENGKLYSDKLTSIQSHPLLRDLSSKNCVLSIDRVFTEYQRTHLLNFLL